MSRQTNLVLTRRIGESISIGDDIIVELLSRRGKQIKLSIRAPEEILVIRSELKNKLDNVDKSSVI